MEGTQITGTFSYELNDAIGAYFAFRKTRPYFGLLKLSMIVTAIVIALTLLSFLPVFVISLLAGFKSSDAVFQLLNKFGVVFILVMLLLLLLPFIRLYEPLTRLRLRRDFEKNRSIYASEYKLAIDEDGFSVDIPDWSSTIGWSRVGKVYEYKDGFLIIYHNGSEYLPIPKRAFQRETDIPEFGELVSQVTGKKIIRI
jgi:hypothetical protein